MDLRLEFVFCSLREEKSFVKLCQEYGISRKTGYKWKERLLEQGSKGLVDLLRKPLTSPTRLPSDQLVYQPGDRQICLFDPHTCQIALITHGRGPIVVLKEEGDSGNGTSSEARN